jgi:hypothetical protein
LVKQLPNLAIRGILSTQNLAIQVILGPLPAQMEKTL